MSKRVYTLYVVIAIILGVLVLDQILKVWIKQSFVPGESYDLLGSWFRLHYIENKGMAFGTQLGKGYWAKLSLSLFRLVAVTAIAYYLYKIIKEKQFMGYVGAIALVFAGALGNIIDSAFYDLIFEPRCAFDCNMAIDNCYERVDEIKQLTCRDRGFLLGNVVDMFQFNMSWPGTKTQVFPAIFNVADSSITVGVALIIIQYRKVFGKKSEQSDNKEQDHQVHDH